MGEHFLKKGEHLVNTLVNTFTGVGEHCEDFSSIIYYILYYFSFFYITFLSFWFFVKSFCITIEYIDRLKSVHKCSQQEEKCSQSLHKAFTKSCKVFTKTPKIPPFYSKMIFLHKTYLYY